MQEQLRKTCRRLLEEKTVGVVIGYAQNCPDEPAFPVFLTQPDEVDLLVWNAWCLPNLVKYLLRPEIRALGKPAIVVKGCDARAIVVLEKESQIDRSQIYVIGMACDGTGQEKCDACDVHLPLAADEVIGAPQAEGDAASRYAALAEFHKKTPEERMAFWQEELSRCVKCYACRQVCPMCYCNRCLMDKNRPTCIDTSATLKGNFAYHMARAFHLAGRCVACGECARACPAGIDLGLLNQSLAKAAEEQFAFRAGVDPQAEPVVGAYSLQDKENFIR